MHNNSYNSIKSNIHLLINIQNVCYPIIQF